MMICPRCDREYPDGIGVCAVDETALKPLDATMEFDPLIGQALGDYEVKQRIGRGGMSIVYRAEHPAIGKSVAIKVLAPDIARDQEQLKRLLEEARIVNEIGHRGIIQIFGSGTTPWGRQYIVMEFLEGEALNIRLVRLGSLPPEEVLQIMDEVAAAVAAAHLKGVIHRDLKPANIYIVKQADGLRYAKVLDFGLAKRTTRPRGSAAQTQLRAAGTPEYMSPEQARGEDVGPYTDIYALGVVAFEMLTGRHPFLAPSPLDMQIKQQSEPAPRVRSIDPTVPESLDLLVTEMLERDPHKRPQSMENIRARVKTAGRELQKLAIDTKRIPASVVSAATLATAAQPRAGWSRAMLTAVVALAGGVALEQQFGVARSVMDPAPAAVVPSPLPPVECVAPPGPDASTEPPDAGAPPEDPQLKLEVLALRFVDIQERSGRLSQDSRSKLRAVRAMLAAPNPTPASRSEVAKELDAFSEELALAPKANRANLARRHAAYLRAARNDARKKAELETIGKSLKDPAVDPNRIEVLLDRYESEFRSR